MNKNTKVALVGGGAVIAAYFLLAPSSDSAGLGGGGGMPLLPALPAEDKDSAGDIIYNFPADPFADPGFTGFEDPVADGAAKKVTTEPVKLDFPSPTGYVRDVNPVTGIARTTGTAIDTTPAGTGLFASLASPEFAEQYKKAKEPVQFEDASIGGFFDFLAPLTQLGKGAVGRSSLYDAPEATENAATATKKAGVANVTGASKTVVTKLLSSRKSSGGYSGGSGYTGGFNAAGGFSRVRISADNPKGTPGWKQVGAKKPTAPGQPDRY